MQHTHIKPLGSQYPQQRSFANILWFKALSFGPWGFHSQPQEGKRDPVHSVFSRLIASWEAAQHWAGEGRGTGYLAVIRRASTSSPMPSTSTTSASSYFCTVLEHKVTWEEKGDMLLFRKASSLRRVGGGGWEPREETVSKCPASLAGWRFTLSKLHCGVRTWWTFSNAGLGIQHC